MKDVFLNILKFLLFLSIGLIILYLVYQRQNTAYQEDCVLKGIPDTECSLVYKVISDFGRVNYLWIGLVLLAFTISNISRAIRWKMLIRPLGYEVRTINSFLTVVIGYFANLGLPRMGEIVRPGLLARYEKAPLEKIMGTVVADRIFDVISILLLTGLAFLLEFDRIWAFFDEYASISEKIGGLGNLLLIGGGLLAIVLLVFFVFRQKIMNSRLALKIRELVIGFIQGLQTVRQLDRPGWFIFHSVNIWVMYFLMTYLCFFAFPPTSHLSALAGFIVFIFGGWGIVIPSPGGMGSYHFLVQTALMMYGVSGDDGFSWAMIAFISIQLGCNILIGLLGLLLLPIINRDYHPALQTS
ncbi:MAG: lysylphosphatidylglycerol synthase transmembrane domain-containing protein [Saprospiraceae bacterium]